MGFLDRLLGREDRSRQRQAASYPPAPGYGQQTGYRTDPPGGVRPVSSQRSPQSEDERAVERYRYLLRTAPPEQIEQAHAEAFAKLTPQQRQQVLAELGSQVPANERARTDDPRDLARMATRAEMRQPGTLERSFSGGGAGGMGGGRGLGMGAVIGGSLLASVAGAFIGTAIADAMFDGFDGSEYAEGFEDGAQADMAADGADPGYDDGGGYDAGYDGGGFDGGGDFGGGDFDV
ncbi:hypothetical protein FHN55_04715 [Streptomyces sp. NP160]|uniref:hypothetical protein n=1 Tax=Streptomyces sp. NP160 TaxID=2586637 RepID=UPI00111AFD03|nr:hypothetical protein [Streptomyces sp. NP160]TNM69101.1 hypothetical protein FHN55_04715 [Streptomyces sp. NP160]